ncbi:radical SAM/SPASM domain-containing protein [Peptacetobacter sp.]|uniref:radical SAM/SPASM domain-containing protein n=1 Tax=Peptacetobacter sp. TaxID=2991975 RepID=UPI0029422990|nr:radical SAM protein [Peptacetobacter sp.]MEE0452180.1 radical SAM protein [Peptacetobacter sp.]
MSDKKYFRKKICQKVISDNKVIISNKLNGKWIKIPEECDKVIEYSVENRLDLNEVKTLFKCENDREYFEKIMICLEKIGLVGNKMDEKLLMGRINLITFSITNKCNLSCDYCCSDSKIYNSIDLQTSEIYKIIDNIIYLNPRVVNITGGEPLIRKDFFEILEYLNKNFKGKIILSTNALLIKKEDIIRLTQNTDYIEISIDGYNEESCKKIRGDNVFTKVMLIVEELKKLKFNNISLSMVVGKNNNCEVEEFIKLNEKLGTKPIIRNFMNIGRGENYYYNYLEDRRDLVYIRKDNYKKLKANMCKAGENQISIDYKGNVYPCPNLEYDDLKMFNILNMNENIKYKIENKELDIFEKIEQLKMNNIKRCENCNLNIFCTPCPAQVYIALRDNEKFSWNCKKMKKILNDIVW